VLRCQSCKLKPRQHWPLVAEIGDYSPFSATIRANSITSICCTDESDRFTVYALVLFTSPTTLRVVPVTCINNTPVLQRVQKKWSRMSLSGYCMSKSDFGHHFLTQSVRLRRIIAWKVTNTDPHSQSQECRWMTVVWGNINYFQIFDSVYQITVVKPE